MTEPHKIEQWPVVRRKVAELIAYERNPRKITPSDYKRLEESLLRFGFMGGVKSTIDGRIIGGHVRIHLLRKHGIEEIDVIQAPRELTEEEYKALLVIDNTGAGTFDPVLLAADYGVAQLQAYMVPQAIIAQMEPVGSKANREITDNSGYTCLVEFTTEAEQEKFYAEMQQRGLTCKLMS